MKKTMIVSAFIMMSAISWALDDTPENRSKQADRYMATSSTKDMIQDFVDKMELQLPVERRQGFKDFMTKHFDFARIDSAVRNATIKVFTADEIKALADFYGSPEGKSAMKKFGAYMAEVMPFVESEMARAISEIDREVKEAKTKK